MKVAIIGTGYVGLITGVGLAHLGHNVACIDIDKNKIEKLNAGQPTIFEKGLSEKIISGLEAKKLFFSTDIGKIKNADVVFICVGTPPLEDGSADLSYVFQAARDIAPYLKENSVVAIKSTVPVGTNEKVKEIISNETDKVIYSVSNPEFLREGRAVDDFFNPDRIVIGTDNDEALQIMRELYADFNCPIVMTDIRSAEMIKYAANAFLATKISFINEIANLCEQVGADVEKVAYGMGLDKRIGSAFLGAGIGYGGSCFPKDVRALRQIAGNNGYDFKLLKAVIEVNKDQKELFWQKIQNHFSDFTGKRIAVLGLGFKAGTDDVRESIGLEYAQRLYAAGAVVIGYDRYAREKAQEVLPQIDYADNLEQIIDFLPDALVITTKDNEFRKIVPLLFQLNEVAIFDGRNLLVGENLQKVNIIYFSVGR